MEGEFSNGKNGGNVERERNEHVAEVGNLQATKSTDSPQDLNSVANQASEVKYQTLRVSNHSIHDPLRDLSPGLSSIPVSNMESSDSLIDANGEPTIISTVLRPSNTLPAVAGEIPNPDTQFPKLEEEQFQQVDGHEPNSPTAQVRDESSGESQVNSSESVAESEEHQIQAFAKLEFGDGEFYMNTHAVELGRDIDAAHRAAERDFEAGRAVDWRSFSRSASKNQSGRSDKAEDENVGDVVESSVRENGYVSQDHRNSKRKKKSRRMKSESWSSQSPPLSRKSSVQSRVAKTDYNALAMASLVDSAPDMKGLGKGGHMPPPDLVPLIPIHPPMYLEGPRRSHKSISRKHIRIAFDFEQHLFQAEILGRNGGFIDDLWYAHGDIIPLVNGSFIQIGGVGVRFVLPDVPQGETGAEMGLGSDALSGRMTSSEREASQENGMETNTEDDIPNIKREGEQAEGPQVSRTRGKGKKITEPPPPAPPKRKGPGRPPKNGIISKREQALLARQGKEEAKAKAEGRPIPQPGQDKEKETKKVKVPKGGESSQQPNGKRKYTRRNGAGVTEEKQVRRESTEHTDSAPPEQGIAAVLPPKPPKEKKPAKPPRSPSPVFDESTLTPEQLAKPPASYVVLIHEALSNSPTGQMSLPQIYRSIERRYPFFKLRVQTQGWQSSVRHNLSQHGAFRKIERDGKGWMWGLVPEVSIEKEKKRRATPPPLSQQHYYPQNPVMRQPYPPYPGFPPPNGRIPPSPYGPYPNIPPGGIPYPPPPRPGFPLPLVNAQSESTYRSPYQSTPPPAPAQSTPQSQKPSTINGTNGNYPTPVSQPPAESSTIHQTLPNSSTGPSANLPPIPKTSTTSHREQDVNEAVTKFKAALISNMDDKIRGETLVTSAVNRVLGLQAKSSLPDEEEDPHEATVMATFSKMLGDLSNKNTDSKAQDPSSGLSPAKAISAPQNGEQQTATALAAEKAAKIALTNGDSAPSTSNEKDGLPQVNGGRKRSLEARDGDAVDDTSQPHAKRIAS